MNEITEKEIEIRLRFDNPWWDKSQGVDSQVRGWPERDYFQPFYRLVMQTDVRRAVLLVGPRRVGKTVMMLQAIQSLLNGGISGQSILYASLDTPIYLDLSIERLLRLFCRVQGLEITASVYVFFDEIQYLRNWEVHLKSFVDSFPNARVVASGSAAAALRLKSIESGAGRFTEFPLPPLTFAEFIRFMELDGELIRPTESPDGGPPVYETGDIQRLNAAFVDYLNFGGYPEAVFSEAVRENPAQYIRSDIIDRVLLKDLPSLYGVSDIQDLNRLLTSLAYRTASEVAYESLSKSSGIAKNTLRRYLEYLEAAFLIRRLRRVDQNARHFRRETAFKVYLTNPALRSALFGLVSDGDDAMGALAETAIFGQWMHAVKSFPALYYARWKGGEVDLIQFLADHTRLVGAVEIKWSDRFFHAPNQLKGLISFAERNGLQRCLSTTRTQRGRLMVREVEIVFEPCSLYCYRIGRHAMAQHGVYDDVFLHWTLREPLGDSAR